MVKKLYNFGFAGYVLLLILSVLFYKERTFFGDGAFYIFDLVHTKSFPVFHSRYIAIFPEILPVAARWLDIDLKLIAVLFSCSYILIHLFCYMLCGAMKKYEYALVLLLYNLLLIADSFYALPSELPVGVAFLVLMFAFVDFRNGRNRVLTFVVVASLCFLIVLSHPLIIFPLLYLGAMLFIFKKHLRRDLAITAVLIVLLTILKLKYFVDQYDADSSQGILKMLHAHYFDLPSHKVFLRNMFTKFYWLPILFIVVMAHLLSRKKWLAFILFLGFIAGYLLMVNITYSDGMAAAFYIENFYLLPGFFLAVPLVLNVLPAFADRKLPVIFLSLVIATAGIRIYTHHGIYTARLNWQRQYLDSNADKKLIVSDRQVPLDVLIMTWATPYEFWMLSTIERGKTASIVISGDTEPYLWATGNTKSFIAAWGLFPYSELPGSYFIFKDTVSSYTVIK